MSLYVAGPRVGRRAGLNIKGVAGFDSRAPKEMDHRGTRPPVGWRMPRGSGVYRGGIMSGESVRPGSRAPFQNPRHGALDFDRGLRVAGPPPSHWRAAAAPAGSASVSWAPGAPAPAARTYAPPSLPPPPCSWPTPWSGAAGAPPPPPPPPRPMEDAFMEAAVPADIFAARGPRQRTRRLVIPRMKNITGPPL